MDFLRQIANGIREAWQQLTLAARVNIVLAGVAVVAIVLFVALTGDAPLYVNLATGLSANDAGALINALDAADIPYRQENGYATVLVPASKLKDAQMLAAEKNLSIGRKRSPAWELFDQPDMMSSNQMLNGIKLTRARQGALQAQLEEYDFVQAAQVILNEPRRVYFTADQEPATASVVLTVSRPPTEREVKLLVSTVVRSGGPKLTRDHVTVGTSDGKTLWDPSEDGIALLASEKLNYKSMLERERESRLQDFFDMRNLPAIFKVSAVVDYDRKEVEDINVYDGSDVSRYTRTTSSTIQEMPPEGSPGALANVAEAAGTPGGTSTSEEDEEEITNSEPSRRTTRTVTEPGNVVKFQVGAIIQGDYEGEDADGNPIYAGLSPEKRKSFEEMIRAIVGEGSEATEVVIGDQDLLAGGWRLAAATEGVSAAEARDRMQSWIWTGVQVLLIILGFLMVRILLRRVIASPELISEEEEEVAEIPEATREDMRRQNVSSEITDLAVNEPEVVAALLRSWMTEDED